MQNTKKYNICVENSNGDKDWMGFFQVFGLCMRIVACSPNGKNGTSNSWHDAIRLSDFESAVRIGISVYPRIGINLKVIRIGCIVFPFARSVFLCIVGQ